MHSGSNRHLNATELYTLLGCVFIMVRSYIDETIESLAKSATKIQSDWDKFKKGEITKEDFEREYHQVLRGWLSELKNEIYEPNNGCKYKDTNEDCEYFNKMDI